MRSPAIEDPKLMLISVATCVPAPTSDRRVVLSFAGVTFRA
jgi:hypothetical protein